MRWVACRSSRRKGEDPSLQEVADRGLALGVRLAEGLKQSDRQWAFDELSKLRRDYEAVEKFYKEVGTKYENFQILVISSGIRSDSIVGMMKTEDWNRVIDTNLTGTFNLSKLAVQSMMRQRYGRIITLTSPIGKDGFAGQANYAASTAGQVAFTRSLSKEVASRKITVNCVSPGFIDTDFISNLPEDQKKAYKNQIPLKRFGTPEDVTYPVLFLASKEAAYITGSVLEVTGGL